MNFFSSFFSVAVVVVGENMCAYCVYVCMYCKFCILLDFTAMRWNDYEI